MAPTSTPLTNSTQPFSTRNVIASTPGALIVMVRRSHSTVSCGHRLLAGGVCPLGRAAAEWASGNRRTAETERDRQVGVAWVRLFRPQQVAPLVCCRQHVHRRGTVRDLCGFRIPRLPAIPTRRVPADLERRGRDGGAVADQAAVHHAELATVAGAVRLLVQQQAVGDVVRRAEQQLRCAVNATAAAIAAEQVAQPHADCLRGRVRALEHGLAAPLHLVQGFNLSTHAEVKCPAIAITRGGLAERSTPAADARVADVALVDAVGGFQLDAAEHPGNRAAVVRGGHAEFALHRRLRRRRFRLENAR